MHQATFNKHGYIHHLDTKIVGQPRRKWIQETMKELFDIHFKPYQDDQELEFNEYNIQHINWLKEQADERFF